MPDLTTRHRLRLARRVVAALTTLLLLAALGTYLSGHVVRTFSDLGMTAAALLGGVNCGLAAQSSFGRLRVAWGGLAAACLAWAVGQAIWSWYELVLGTETPFPGLADVGFLCFPIGAVVGITVFPSQASQADRRRMTLDGLMAASAIGLVSWATTLGAVVDGGGPSLLATVVSVTYPVSDIVLLVVCVLVLSRSKAHRLPLALVGAGLALMAVADSGFAYLTATGALMDLGWFFAFGLLAFAPLVPGATSTSSATRALVVAGTALPYVPLGGVIVFVGWQYGSGYQLTAVEVVLVAVIVLLVLSRQFLTVRDNHRLALALAAREAELLHQAFHDGLTGLANRALFVDRLAHALELHRRDERPLTICFLDLDGFKSVNDKLGHSAGDDLLREASARFRTVLSSADTLARFGGDEFAVLLEDRADPEEAAWALLGCLRVPFTVGRGEVSVLASIGVAQVDAADMTPTVDGLLARADLAMYVVKRRGKAGVLLHSEGLQIEEVDDVVLGRSLAQALVDRQVTVAYQPIVDLATGRLDTLEALARWAPGGRPVSPELFVRVAENCNLIDPLFQFVLAESCRQVARWTALPGGSDVRVAVNVSPCQLSSPGFPLVVAAELARHDLNGNRLILEITESGVLEDTALSHTICHELRRLGVRLSVDDFGTGLSSLARLRDLPIDEVKIDRSFVADVEQVALAPVSPGARMDRVAAWAWHAGRCRTSSSWQAARRMPRPMGPAAPGSHPETTSLAERATRPAARRASRRGCGGWSRPSWCSSSQSAWWSQTGVRLPARLHAPPSPGSLRPSLGR
jgi:diguanylate cyclase (GGDEF)-like protein